MNNTNEYLMKEARKELARKGGEANLKKHGKEFYKELSKKGVAARTCSAVDCTTIINRKTARYLNGHPLCDTHAAQADGMTQEIKGKCPECGERTANGYATEIRDCKYCK